MGQVFISHSEKDESTAKEIASALEEVGYSVWYYERDSNPGPSYLRQINNAIEECQVVLVLISRNSIDSPQVEREVEWAADKGKKFVPVLHGLQWKEFREQRLEWGIALGVAAGIAIPQGGVTAILPRILKGLESLKIEVGSMPVRQGKTNPPPESVPKREPKPAATNTTLRGKYPKSSFKPDGTMSNPKYEKDILSLQPTYDLRTVINPETILIVVGATVVADLLDRPVAELLRDQIDQKGGDYPYRRGIVITDEAWYGEECELVFANPVIAVGGPAENRLANEFDEWNPPPGSNEGRYLIRTADAVTGFFKTNEEGLPQVGLWGDTASGTRDAVRHYKDDPAGLREFLRMCWQRP